MPSPVAPPPAQLFAHATAVLLPGSGSDANFAIRAFAPITRRCARTVAVDPTPPSVLDVYRAALDAAAGTGPLVVCGVSLGSAVAARWILDSPAANTGETTLILTLPPWTGSPGPTTPAALSAGITADAVQTDGLDAAIAAMVDGSPQWLGEELSRSWRGHGEFLVPALREAAGYPAPTLEQLRSVRARTAIVAARLDPVHPAQVAREWASSIPDAHDAAVDLAEIGADPAVLGRAALGALADPVD